MADNERGGRWRSLKTILSWPRFSLVPEDIRPANEIEEGSGHEEHSEAHPDDPLIRRQQPPRRSSIPASQNLKRLLVLLLGILSTLLLSWHLGYLPFLSSPSRDTPPPEKPKQPEPEPEPPRVSLNYTTYEGERLSSNISRFLGMRYAAPPLGNLRFRAPVEPPHPSPNSKPIIKQATRFRPICLAAGRGYPYGDQSEDCLFVNVWAPADAIPGKSNLPVWVFISGGGYNSLSNANWNGEGVVQKSGGKIILVNFNYRVGMWGFLASEKVREDGDLNVGLLDQRMVLKWVRKYIAEVRTLFVLKFSKDVRLMKKLSLFSSAEIQTTSSSTALRPGQAP